MEEAKFFQVLRRGSVSSYAKESGQGSPEFTLICFMMDLLGDTEVKLG